MMAKKQFTPRKHSYNKGARFGVYVITGQPVFDEERNCIVYPVKCTECNEEYFFTRTQLQEKTYKNVGRCRHCPQPTKGDKRYTRTNTDELIGGDIGKLFLSGKL